MASRPGTADRTRRMLALLPHLHRGETLSLAWLASLVGCSTEEVAADLVTLAMCGLPPFDPANLIELVIDEDTVSVMIEPHGLNRPVRFTHAECRALASALEEIGYAPESGLLERLLASASPSAAPDELRRTLLAATAPGGTGDIFATLAEAAESREKVRIVYHTGSTGRTSARVIHPWELSNRHGVSYVAAFCEQAGAERVFRLDRIREADAIGERFERPAETSSAVVPDTSVLPVARVRFAPGAALPDEYDWPGMSMEAGGSGAGDSGGGDPADRSTIVRVPYQGPHWLARRVAAYLGEAEVLEPAEVRVAVREIAGAMLDEMESGGPAAG